MTAISTSRRTARAPIGAFFALLSTTLLAGCVVGPDYEKPNLVIPASWSTKGQNTIEKPAELAQWWKRLNDPLLDAYISQAVESNLDVAAAKARVSEARANLRQETGALFPSVGASSSAQRTRISADSSGDGSAQVFTQYQGGFDASWEIDLFGGRRRAVEAARYGLDAAEEDLRNTLLVLIGDVASNYSQARAYQARAALARQTARAQRESATLIRTKAEAGSASSGDVANAEALAASTEADVPTYEIQRMAALHRLGVLLGRALGTLSAELHKPAPIPRPRFPLPVGIPADILLARPDVRMAERQLAKATARIGAAEAARYPAVSLTGNIATQALNLSSFAENSTIAWAIGPGVTVPLFKGGQLAAAADAARARRDQAFLGYHSTVLTAMEDVENAIVSLSNERVRSGRLAAAVTSYRTAANASRAQFEAGTRGYLDLLDAQRALYNADGNLINSQLALVLSYIALHKALGGGWDGAVDTLTPHISGENNGPRIAQASTGGTH